MSRIQLLSEEVANQVAAGEVIERPASVIKELVENSLDAGARRIEVMIRRGGISLIRVADDGSGMDRDDALLCLERHATSKIRTGSDLAAISTLGFRGEALPSIASVSRFRLHTRPHDALAGTEVAVNGGRIEHVCDSGEAPGTQVEVRSLFFNLPARRKFLRTETTEASHCEHALYLQAVGHPETAFVFVQDERVTKQLPATRRLIERIRDFCGAALASQLIEVPDENLDGIRIRGFIGKPGVSRSSRAQQIVFINGRAVENSTVNYSLREAYHTALMKGQYPVTFLFLEIDPAEVDVNVHPAKREVRFRDAGRVRDAIIELARRAIDRERGGWARTFQPPPPPGLESRAPLPLSSASEAADLEPEPEPSPVESAGPGTGAISATAGTFQPSAFAGNETPPLIDPREQVALRRDWSALPLQPSPGPAAPARLETAAAVELHRTSPPATAPSSTQHFRILGVLGRLYVLMENNAGLVLVDQHAAHERILFEELRRRMEEHGVPAQRLLMPLTIQLTPTDADWITQNLATLQRMGIGIEAFGAGTFKIDTLPQFIRTGEPLQILRDIIEELRQVSSSTSKMRLGEEVIASTVCRHAVKANDYLREPELLRLIQDLLRCDLPYCCPHGRPTMIQISYAELEKKFGRKV